MASCVTVVLGLFGLIGSCYCTYYYGNNLGVGSRMLVPSTGFIGANTGFIGAGTGHGIMNTGYYGLGNAVGNLGVNYIRGGNLGIGRGWGKGYYKGWGNGNLGVGIGNVGLSGYNYGLNNGYNYNMGLPAIGSKGYYRGSAGLIGNGWNNNLIGNIGVPYYTGSLGINSGIGASNLGFMGSKGKLY